MFVRRSAYVLGRRSAFNAVPRRTFKAFVAQKNKIDPAPGEHDKRIKSFAEITSEEDLLPPGAAPGTVPTDLEQATGLDRLEILGKMQGIDVFDMRPLDASRKGTMDNPIMVKSFGEEQYAGCTGFPADSHNVKWLVMSRSRPLERCSECGNVLKMEYVGPTDTHHDPNDPYAVSDGLHNYDEPRSFAAYVKPEYWYR